jgi:hypothetical protein
LTVCATALGIVVAGFLSARPDSTAAAPTQGGSEGPTVSEVIVTASKTVAELTVTAKVRCVGPDRSAQRGERPKVVSTFPSKGSVVRSGLLVVRVTFDQPMACDGSFTGAPPLQNPCPGVSREMLLSYDRRTVRTVCIVEPNAQYGLWVSQDPTSRSFLGLAGLPSEAYRLTFSTSAEPAVTTVCDAMVQDDVTAMQVRQRRDLDCSNDRPSSGR